MELKNIIRECKAVLATPLLLTWLCMLLVLPIYRVETFKCRCVNQRCYPNGSCHPGFKCDNKYFGYFCEYINFDGRHSEFIPQLEDKDYKTCAVIDDEFTTNYAKTRIYMIRLIVKDSSQFKNISVLLKDRTWERDCKGIVFTPEETIVEYYCSTLDYSNSLTIRGIASNEICHVHLTTGRNMAIGGSVITKASADDGDFYRKEGLVDESKLPIAQSCFLTKRYDDLLKISIALKSLSVVNYVEAFDSSRLTLPIAGTRVEFVNAQKATTRSVTLLVSPWRAHYVLGGSPVSMVTLSKKGQLGACEIEVLGDCNYGTYGLDCKGKCKPRCKDSRCTTTGLCIGCEEGLTGTRCCYEFCNPDEDCGDDGRCINGCVDKHYGTDCFRECSPNCGGDGNCSPMGDCLEGCKTGYSGLSCDNECQPPYFGLNCNDTCHVRCFERRCDYNGACFGESDESDDKRGSQGYAERLTSTAFIYIIITMFVIVRLAFL